MKIKKKLLYGLVLILFFMIGLNVRSYAETGEIIYKATYKDAISYTISITGLEGNEEEYDYRAMICQEQDVTPSKFAAVLGKSFPIKYNKDAKKWEGNTSTALDGVKTYDTFERKGQYYAYIARNKKNTTTYEILDGPKAIETPKLPSLGSRIAIQTFTWGDTRYSIKVNAHNTMLMNGVQRTINFYVGEITDKTLLEKLSKNGTGTYEELLQYAKSQEKNLKVDSFKDTKTGVLDYNIVQNYPIENGKYYFLHSILDNENDTYVDVEDIGIYNGEVTKDGKKGLANFKYQPISEDQELLNQSQKQEKNTKIDATSAKGILPKAGKTVIGIIMILVVMIAIIALYIKNKQYKGIK